jgi:hypothetical protein
MKRPKRQAKSLDDQYADMVRYVEYWRELYRLAELAQEQIGPAIDAVDLAIAERGDPPPQVIELQAALKDTRRELKTFFKTKPKPP